MIFPRDSFLTLSPLNLGAYLPLTPVLRRWMDAGFDRDRCHEALQELLWQYRARPDLVRPEAVRAGGLVLTEGALFPAVDEWKLRVVYPRPEGGSAFEVFKLGTEEVGAAAAMIRDGCAEGDLGHFRDRYIDRLGPAVLDGLARGRAPGPGAALWQNADLPGIYRREHASLLFRSRTTTLLVDPIPLLTGFPSIKDAPTNLGAPALDAILITHVHGDHFHIPSLLRYMTDGPVPVVVPKVPAVNFLTPLDFTESLTLAGVPATPAPWGTTLHFGDIEVDVLPFYGEQPTRDAPGPDPRLRSWGNCYRIQAPDYSALVLVDSGADPMGDMLEVVSESCRKRGPVDALLSSSRIFASPFFGGLHEYFATLPFEHVAGLYRQFLEGTLPTTTAGPAGIVELCAAAQARHYLPYANGFYGIGRGIDDIGWGCGEPAERDVLTGIEARLQVLGLACRALPWLTGDVARAGPSGLVVTPHTR